MPRYNVGVILSALSMGSCQILIFTIIKPFGKSDDPLLAGLGPFEPLIETAKNSLSLPFSGSLSKYDIPSEFFLITTYQRSYS